jgi:hypothetical protein
MQECLLVTCCHRGAEMDSGQGTLPTGADANTEATTCRSPPDPIPLYVNDPHTRSHNSGLQSSIAGSLHRLQALTVTGNHR